MVSVSGIASTVLESAAFQPAVGQRFRGAFYHLATTEPQAAERGLPVRPHFTGSPISGSFSASS
jgi:hypothetical protein